MFCDNQAYKWLKQDRTYQSDIPSTDLSVPFTSLEYYSRHTSKRRATLTIAASGFLPCLSVVLQSVVRLTFTTLEQTRECRGS